MTFLSLLLGFLLQSMPFALLCFQPFAKQLRYSRRKIAVLTGVLCVGLGAAFAAAGCALKANYHGTGQELFMAANAVFTAALIPCFLWYVWAVIAPWAKKLFVFSYALTGALMITSANNFIVYMLGLNGEGGLPYRGATLPLLLLFTAILLPVLSFLLRRFYEPIEASFQQKENVYLAVLSIILFIVMYSGLTYIDYIATLNVMTLFLFAALLVAVLILYAICFDLFKTAYEKLLAQQKYGEAQRLLALGDMQYRRLSENMELTRRMRHDLHHHMVTLQGFLKSGATGQAEQYLSQVLEITEEHEIAKVCGNPLVDLVVNYYRAQAEERGVQMTVRVAIPDELPILDADLSVVLGNLLENAVCAAEQCGEGEGFIRFNMICSGQMLVVAVDNSFIGRLRMDGGKYLSSKEDHIGYGLQSVEAIAEKYDGGVEFTHEDGVFHSSVMMNLAASAGQSEM